MAAKQYRLSKRLTYRHKDFACSCGCKKFVYAPKKLTISGTELTRHEHRCAQCDVRYIFIDYSAANGTVF